jgi:hypothetical protein
VAQFQEPDTRRGALALVGAARILLVLLVAALVTGATADASAADTVVSHERRPTLVTAYRGRVAWSGYNRVRHFYRLKALVHGRVVRLPVPPRRVPFDVDLGPDARGRTVAVYSRCKHEPSVGVEAVGNVADYVDARGCDLYAYRFGARHEYRVRVRGASRASEFFPTIWARTIAFARVWEQRKGRAGVYPYLYYAPVGGGTPHRTPGGTRGRYVNITIAEGDPPEYDGGPGPLGLDLRGRILAFVWDSTHDRCSAAEDRHVLGSIQSEVWLGRLGTRPRLVARGCETNIGTVFLSSPAFDGPLLWYEESRNTNDPDDALRIDSYDPATATVTAHPAPPHILSLARDAGTTYYSAWHSDAFNSVDIVRSG